MSKIASVVIPCLNEEKYISGILADLKNQTLKNFETILVDGTSIDETVNVAGKFNIKIISTKPSVAHQRNLGAKKTEGQWIFFIDADTRIDKDFLKSAIDRMQDKRLELACPWYKPYPGSLFINFFFFCLNILFLTTAKLTPSGAGCCIVVKRSIFKKTQGFDTKLRYDDIEFIRRCSKISKFGILRLKVEVSDRRFRQYPIVLMTLKYCLLSCLFFLGLFKLANLIDYKFGEFK